MRPDEDGRHVALLLAALPEFVPAHDELLALYDDDLTVEVVLNELAAFASGLLDSSEDREAPLERCFEAVEALCRLDEESAEVVAWSFLAALDAPALQRAASYLGPISASLLPPDEPGLS